MVFSTEEDLLDASRNLVSTTLHLRNIDMTDPGESFTDCYYLLILYVWDTTVRHSFNGHVVNDVIGAASSNAFITFAASL